MDWVILASVTLGLSALVALVARDVATRIAQAKGDMDAMAILIAIVVTLVVLQGAAKLAVVVEWSYARAGVEMATALGGRAMAVAFAASFVPIAAYVGVFFWTFRKVKGATD